MDRIRLFKLVVINENKKGIYRPCSRYLCVGEDKECVTCWRWRSRLGRKYVELRWHLHGRLNSDAGPRFLPTSSRLGNIRSHWPSVKEQKVRGYGSVTKVWLISNCSHVKKKPRNFFALWRTSSYRRYCPSSGLIPRQEMWANGTHEAGYHQNATAYVTTQTNIKDA